MRDSGPHRFPRRCRESLIETVARTTVVSILVHCPAADSGLAVIDSRELRKTRLNESRVAGSVRLGEAFGPWIDYLGTGATDVFEDYVRSSFVLAGYADAEIVFADARYYHDGCGPLHCGSNASRAIPSENWWEDVAP